MSHVENFIKTESSLSAVHSWKNLHGCLAELDGMMLKAQLFIVAPAKKLWPWQNSAGGFGLDLVCSQQKQRCVKDFFENWSGAIITHQSLAQSQSDISHWCVIEADLYELELCIYLWPLTCITKFSVTPCSIKQTRNWHFMDGMIHFSVLSG